MGRVLDTLPIENRSAAARKGKKGKTNVQDCCYQTDV